MIVIGANRERRWWASLERRSKARGVPYRLVPLLSIIEKTAACCWLCGLPVHGEAWEIDHAFPLSLGGTSLPHNLWLAHRSCNQHKGAKITMTHLPEGPERHALEVMARASLRLKRLPGKSSIRCRPGPFSVGARTVTARLKLPTSGAPVARRALAAADDLRAALDDPGARVYVAGRYLTIEVSNPWPLEPDEYDLAPAGAVLPLGFGQDMEQVAVDLDQTPQLLGAGQTGSGKSTAAWTLAWAAARAGHQLVLVDTRCVLWNDLADLSCLALGVPLTRDDATPTLKALVDIMFSRPPKSELNPRKIILLVDEAGNPRNGENLGLPEAAMAALGTIMTNGRKHGVHAVVFDQRPCADRLSRDIIDSSVGRLGLRVGDHWTASTASVKGAQHLLGRGDAILFAGGVAERFQVCRIDARWSEIPRGGAPGPVVSLEPRGQERADDTALLQAARAHGADNPSAVMRLARQLGLGEGGRGIGRARAERIATGLLANSEGVLT